MVNLASMVVSSFPSDRRTYDSVLMLSNSTRKVKLVADVVPKGVEFSIITIFTVGSIEDKHFSSTLKLVL